MDLPLDLCGGFQVDPLHTAVPLASLLQLGGKDFPLLQLGGRDFPLLVLLNLRSGHGGADAGSHHVS